jgi:hypothetical protein
MLTDDQIKTLIGCDKKIVNADPKKGMKPDGKSDFLQRRNLDVCSLSEQESFTVFLRKNNFLIEQFSIGIIYKTRVKEPGSIMLLRYNGIHGTKDYSIDGHYGNFHIHTITETLLNQGIYEPQETKKTSSYTSFDQALNLFLLKLNIINIKEFFPAPNIQLELF